ncbi:MAG: DNA-processing protein DprA [Agarilytica sp.]
MQEVHSASPSISLPVSELEAALLLLGIKGFGVSRYWQLIAAISRPSAVFELPEAALSAFFSSTHLQEVKRLRCEAAHPGRFSAARCIEWCQLNQVRLLHHLDDDYPALLKHIHRAPPYIFVKGNVLALSEKQVAVVGSRSATKTGLEQAKWVSHHLADAGYAITSGLALGVDSHAHLGALAAAGVTIAVVGTGIDQTYPYRNRYLAERIVAEGGAIVSEFPLGTVATPQNFPQRNRIISGLSVGTLVVEAALKSGSLITADYALEQNREVFALPGSTQSNLSRGCHQLIKQGGTLVENAQDIIAELEGFSSRPLEDPPQALASKSFGLASTALHRGEIKTGQRCLSSVSNTAMIPDKANAQVSLSDDQQQVLAKIHHDPISLDALVLETQLPVGNLMSALMALEVNGFIENDVGHYTRAFDGAVV